jgi:hypothetical protein
MRQQSAEPAGLLATLMLALLLVGIATVMLAVQAVQAIVPADLHTLLHPTTPARPTDGARPPARRSTVSMASTAPAASSDTAPVAAADSASSALPAEPAADAAPVAPAAPGLAVGQRARVAHTDGVGVVLHSAPNTSARRPAGLMDGMPVTVLALADSDWAQVQSDSKQTGWVPAAFLVGE